MQGEHKVALVTGGAGGIGFDAAMEFVKAGCRVVVADIDNVGGGNTMETGAQPTCRRDVAHHAAEAAC